MKRIVALSVLPVLAAVSLALAASPKPMACDSWKCGPKCAPAKYVAVRYPPTILPQFETQIYGAAVVEGGIGLVAVLAGLRLAARRRSAEKRRRASAAIASERGEA